MVGTNNRYPVRMLTEAPRRNAGSFFFGLDFCRRRSVVRQSGRFDTFVAKIHHFVHFFVRKVAFQRERAYIRCAEIVLSIMLERIQYALFVLLFVLAGSLDGATPQGGACRVQPGMSPQAALHAPVTAQNYFTAAVMLSGDASIEIPAHSSEHKAIVRHRFYARSAAAEAVAQQNSALSDRGALYSKPVDYYIFSLGRILI